MPYRDIGEPYTRVLRQTLGVRRFSASFCPLISLRSFFTTVAGDPHGETLGAARNAAHARGCTSY